MLIYIHGFNSSALSFKAALLRKRMAMLGRSREFIAPELPHRPREAIALLEALVLEASAQALTLVGSSLGGYYATWLTEHYGCRAVLVNPAVRPYDLLGSYVGPQINLYNGARYELTAQHINELRELEVSAVTSGRYLALLAKGDELLDYRDAMRHYAGCKQIVVERGDHGFSDFERYLEDVLAFAGLSYSAGMAVTRL